MRIPPLHPCSTSLLPGLVTAALLAAPAGAQQHQSVAAPAPLQAVPTAPVPALPLDLGDHAARIERLIALGQPVEAMAAARAFMEAVGEGTGFGVTNVQLVQAQAPSFGVYLPRASNVFDIGETVYTYVELYGFSLEAVPDMANRMVFDVAFTVHGPDGTQMTDSMISMGQVVLNTYSRPLDGYLNLTYRIAGAQGPAILRTQITDHASGQVAEFSVPVVFRPGGAEDSK